MKIQLTASIVLSLAVLGVGPVAYVSAQEAPAAVAPAGVNYEQKAQQIIDKGLAYLKAQQQKDGGWQRSDREPPAITALALRAFVQDHAYNSKTDFVANGFKKLLSYKAADGGIYKDLYANYNTCIAVATLVAANDPELKPTIDAAIEHLRKLQWTEDTRPDFVGKNEQSTGQQVVKGKDDPFYGGWGYGGRGRGAGRADLSNTQMAVDALHDAGYGKDDPSMQKAVTFISRLQNNSETNTAPWADNDGGFIYGPSDDRSGESFAGKTTDASGKVRIKSMGSMSYAGLKSLIYAGVTKDDPRVKAVWSWVNKNFNLDYHIGRPEEAKMDGYYYYLQTLARTLHAYGEPLLTTSESTKIDWRQALIDKAEKLQKEDGSFSGSKAEMEDNPILVTSYVMLALQEAQKDLKDHPAK